MQRPSGRARSRNTVRIAVNAVAAGFHFGSIAEVRLKDALRSASTPAMRHLGDEKSGPRLLAGLPRRQHHRQ